MHHHVFFPFKQLEEVKFNTLNYTHIGPIKSKPFVSIITVEVAHTFYIEFGV